MRQKQLLPLVNTTKHDGSAKAHRGQAPGTQSLNPPKPAARKILLVIFFSLLAIGLLERPLAYYHSRVPQSNSGPNKSPSGSGKGLSSPEQRARQVLSSTPLIDGHVDFPVLLRFAFGNHIYADNFTKPFVNGGLPGHVDLHRLREGRSGGAFWSMYAPCPDNGSDFSDANYASSVQFTMNQIDVMTRLQAAYPRDFSQQVESGNALAAFKQGKLISPLGIEGLHQIGNSAANLRKFYELGVRYATLTHNCHNKFADAAILESPMRKAEPLWGGVSPLGRKLIHEMNRIGMIVDLSHVSQDTMTDVLGHGGDWSGSRAPVIFSHSSAYSICPHPRNVKDHVLRMVKEKNSLVMVNIAPEFISCVDSGNGNGLPDFDPAHSNLVQAAKHIVHIGTLIGFEHVGIGTDFDGIENVPVGLEDVSKYPDLVAELLRQGVSDADAAKVVGGNVLRVWKEVDAVAHQMQAEGALPLEDDLPKPNLDAALN